MTLSITHDLRHQDAVKASALRLAVTRATLEEIDQGLSAATERLSTVTGKLRSGDQTVTTTQLRNARDDVDRFGYLHAGAANSARAAENGVVNDDTAVGDAILQLIQGDGHNQFPVDAILGVLPPTAELIDQRRPVLYIQQTKPGNLSAGGYTSGEANVMFFPRTTLEKAPDRVLLFRSLQAKHPDITVDGYGPPQLGDPAPTGYRVAAKFILPPTPMLRGGPDFDTFLKSRANVALKRLMQKAGLSGVVQLGAVTVSGPSNEDGITTQMVAVRVQVGANDQYRAGTEAACLESAQAALRVDGPHGYVGAVTVQESGGKPLPSIKLSTTVRTLATEPNVTAEATVILKLTYRYEDAPEDVATGNPDDVVTDANGEEHYGWEIGN
jgi:hypothetical protein